MTDLTDDVLPCLDIFFPRMKSHDMFIVFAALFDRTPFDKVDTHHSFQFPIRCCQSATVLGDQSLVKSIVASWIYMGKTGYFSTELALVLLVGSDSSQLPLLLHSSAAAIMST